MRCHLLVLLSTIFFSNFCAKTSTQFILYWFWTCTLQYYICTKCIYVFLCEYNKVLHFFLQPPASLCVRPFFDFTITRFVYGHALLLSWTLASCLYIIYVHIELPLYYYTILFLSRHFELYLLEVKTVFCQLCWLKILHI